MLANIIAKLKKHKYKILAAISFAAAGYFFYCSFNNQRAIKLSAFLDALRSEQINEIAIKGDVVYFRSLTSDWYHSILGRYPLHELFRQIKSIPNLSFTCQDQGLSPALLLQLSIPLAGIFILYKSLPSQLSQDNTKRNAQTHTIQSFNSYYGGNKIKESLKQTIQFLKNPIKYQKLGLRIRRGILFYGPPGTGKTMLARILANEAGLEFLSASASQFEQIFVGVGPKRIRDIFKRARNAQKGCLIFIDEIDAIGSRTQNWQTKQQRSTINQLLSEIDGFTQNNKIFLVGATNNIKLVDPALLRPGRFDLKIYVPLPTQQQRVGIVQTLLKQKQMPNNLSLQDIQEIAKRTQGCSGADLESLLNQSGYQTIRKGIGQVRIENVLSTMAQVGVKIND